MAFRVQIEKRDAGFTVEDGETVLAAGLRQGLALPFGCQSGGCGSCRVRCVSGRVQYSVPPHALSPEEVDAGYVLMCMARPQGDLVLDLHQPPGAEALRPRKLPTRLIDRKMLAHDVIGLTFKLPRDQAQWPEEYGVMKLETVPQGIVEQHLMPFRRKKTFDEFVD